MSVASFKIEQLSLDLKEADMKNRMSLQARQELLEQVRKRYHSANRIEKGKIFDGFIAATAYPRKYVNGTFEVESV